jgi:hypothetical protein
MQQKMSIEDRVNLMRMLIYKVSSLYCSADFIIETFHRMVVAIEE